MSYSIDIYDKWWKVVSNFLLDETKFNDELINESLIHEYYIIQTSSARKNIAKVKWRWEIRGSWRKLYKQKWTGNARAWDKNSPIRRWGWVAFGPRWVANYTKSMSKKARKIALYGLLTLKLKDSEILGLKDFEIKLPKTKEAKDVLKNIWLDNKKVLLVLNQKDENIEKSFRNITNLKYLTADYLNPYDIMNCDKIVIMESALQKIN